MKGRVEFIDSKTAGEFLLPRHYSGRLPCISKAFGWYFGDELKAVCTFGKPASPSLCNGICGKEYSHQVFELNRLCRTDDLKEPLSQFVSACLRRLRANNWIIVSYSDTGMHHNGYIYQACNFIYTGRTKPRTDIYSGYGKHSRHYDKEEPQQYRVVRTAKNRYVYFCTFSKKLKKEWMENLNYPAMDYPKDENRNYTLGEYQKPIVVDSKTREQVNV